LKEKNPNIKVIGADPFGSIYKTYKDTGKIPETTPYLVEGIGQEVLPPNAHMQYVDEVLNVSDHDSFETARPVGTSRRNFCGGSTGTNCAAAFAWPVTWMKTRSSSLSFATPGRTLSLEIHS